MTSDQALRFAVDQLPAIPQDPAGYGLVSVIEYRDFTVYRFLRKTLHAGQSPVRVTVRDSRLTPDSAPSASYEVL